VSVADGLNLSQLKVNILALSSATEWTSAVTEWSLSGIDMADEPETCLCGHFPIIELCTIHNHITNNRTTVGNVCIKRFFSIRSDLVFDGIKRVRHDSAKALNGEALDLLYQRKIINKWEYAFSINTLAKRKLSIAQLKSRKSINNKVITLIARRGLR